ncbi:MCE family protein [Mycobacterium sp. CVI_P3]|uniref:MCE family protein n=1 Tax=Mycobacterium pinniadriaticum TaxID=2994102 RepID=A0ABT3SG73_9MYCO|nr:MCE family protein [Mycobacterium pinniadriaticum]MCX2931782.1 MCE family protein [Mycobacterium pinniadriaticum]MCX2938143.1 MCE family protein [Mycobacterium pinniadriaticum]
MKSFTERNEIIIGAVGVAVVLGLALISLNWNRMPFLDRTTEHSAYFTEAGGLKPGAPVQVKGYEVGTVTAVELAVPRVLVKFNMNKDIRVGDRSEAAVKTKSLLGAKFLEVTPRGDGEQTDPIPLDRTRPAYQLPDALGELTSTISGLDTEQLSQSLAVLSDTFKDTPLKLKTAVEGVARFSDTLDKRDSQLRQLLANGEKTTSVLAERTEQVVSLITDTNSLLAQLRTQSAALDQISGNISALAQQLKGVITENKETLKPALDKLNGVLTIVDNRKEALQQSIKKLNAFAMSMGESVATGPFFKAYLANLLPGQFVQPFIDAAFSDLGLDPATKLPSELSDPQVGQPGTPALPMPFPRTGQGGEPRLNLPDAITGNPGDPRYPYREPPPAPPPGGPPPGPPDPGPPNLRGALPPPEPFLVPAPGEGGQ